MKRKRRLQRVLLMVLSMIFALIGSAMVFVYIISISNIERIESSEHLIEEKKIKRLDSDIGYGDSVSLISLKNKIIACFGYKAAESFYIMPIPGENNYAQANWGVNADAYLYTGNIFIFTFWRLIFPVLVSSYLAWFTFTHRGEKWEFIDD
ncbi:MAG: hypothetical protein CML13_13750 [Puniceicoccaceae bacterium]|nr:hypothetical protein [Puniceicoccaceae bacterium]